MHLVLGAPRPSDLDQLLQHLLDLWGQVRSTTAGIHAEATLEATQGQISSQSPTDATSER